MDKEKYPNISDELNRINSIVSAYWGLTENEYHQDISCPFFIGLESMNYTEPGSLVYSFFSPEKQINELSSFRATEQRAMHQHNCFELSYILKGNLYRIIEGKRYYYGPGSCCLMNRNTLHTEAGTSESSLSFFIDFTYEFAKDIAGYKDKMLFPEEAANYNNLIFQFLNEQFNKDLKSRRDFLDFVPQITELQQEKLLHNLFENMVRTMIAPYFGATWRIRELFYQLTDILCNPKYYHFTHVTPNCSPESMIFTRIDYILEKRNGIIRNDELSQMLNYTDAYLSRIVKKHTGLSLYEYRMNFTMKYAADQICNTEKSIAEIVSETGISNRTRFYRLFKKRYGMTPGEYREVQKS